jgi:predicted alpha/beta-hydrolase family hydrolase
LEIPRDARGLVLFAHGSGSSRNSPRNQFVANVLREAGSGTLVFDLLTQDEEREDTLTGHLRFDIRFLAERLEAARQWASVHAVAQEFSIGYFGSSTGGAAALLAAARPVRALMQLCRVVDGPISPARRCRSLKRQRC